jgi:hypothetical protein
MKWDIKTKKVSSVRQSYWKASKTPIFMQKNDDERLSEANLTKQLIRIREKIEKIGEKAKKYGAKYEDIKNVRKAED